MKILLLQPPQSAEAAYPLALASLVPILRRAGHEVVGLDLQLDPPELPHGLDCIAASVLPANAHKVAPLLAQAPRSFVLGAWATLDPERALRNSGADVALSGTPEGLVTAVAEGRTTDAIVTDPTPPALATLPLMDREVFPIGRYSHAMRAVQTPYAGTFTSRGCGDSCSFCPVPRLKGGHFDARPPEQVLDEMRSLARLGMRSVHIEDDAFAADRGRVLELCDAARTAPPGVVWELVNGIRPEHVDGLLLQEMAAAGCRRIVFGFEHLHCGDGTFGFPAPLAAGLVAAARRAGLRVGGYFLVGLPGVGRRATLRGIREALTLGLDDANFMPFSPLPGAAWEREQSGGHRLARLASAAFFAHPRVAHRLLTDLRHDPSVLPALASKSWELLRSGGPNPLRDMP